LTGELPEVKLHNTILAIFGSGIEGGKQYYYKYKYNSYK
jgi:hypothetical protein